MSHKIEREKKNYTNCYFRGRELSDNEIMSGSCGLDSGDGTHVCLCLDSIKYRNKLSELKDKADSIAEVGSRVDKHIEVEAEGDRTELFRNEVRRNIKESCSFEMHHNGLTVSLYFDSKSIMIGLGEVFDSEYVLRMAPEYLKIVLAELIDDIMSDSSKFSISFDSDEGPEEKPDFLSRFIDENNPLDLFSGDKGDVKE